MTTNQLDKILTAFNVLPFRQESYKPKYNAQSNLNERTHYVDDQTLRFFNCRINGSKHIMQGSYFMLNESLPIGGFDAPRKHRVTLFDLTGEVVLQTEGYNSSKKASEAFWAAFDSFDHVGHYERKAAYKIDSVKRQLEKLQIVAEGV